MHTYIFDTNVLLNNYQSLYSYEGKIMLPMTVINELDKFKRDQDEVGRNARETIRILDSLAQSGDLTKGIPLNEKSTIQVIMSNMDKKNDDAIIDAALAIKAKNKTLVSMDTHMRVKAHIYGLSAISSTTNGISIKRDEIYPGYTSIEVSSGTIDKLYKDQKIRYPNAELFPNQYVTLTCEGDPKKSGLGVYRSDGMIHRIVDIGEVNGIKPKNREQVFALSALLDQQIDLVTLLGNAGCGKTLLALAAATQMADKKHGKYQRIIVMRPIVPLGKDIGFLPGTEKEKIDPWMRPIYDNLLFLYPDKPYVDMMIKNGEIAFEALTYMRGRSVPNAIIILDEGQNATKSEVKTLITRAGMNSKVIITADINQIDSPYLDCINNGATYCVERMKQHDICAHVTLTKGERSALATLASNTL